MKKTIAAIAAIVSSLFFAASTQAQVVSQDFCNAIADEVDRLIALNSGWYHSANKLFVAKGLGECLGVCECSSRGN